MTNQAGSCEFLILVANNTFPSPDTADTLKLMYSSYTIKHLTFLIA